MLFFYATFFFGCVFHLYISLKVLSAESQQLMSGAGNSTSLPTEIPMAEDPNFKVGKLSVEERKEKIHRYMKKRNERNFTKKIKVLSPPSI